MSKIWVSDNMWGCASSGCYIEVRSLSEAINKARRKYGNIKDVKVVPCFVDCNGHGLDYEGAYYKFYIEFKRLETDKEEVKRTSQEIRKLKNEQEMFDELNEDR